MYNFSEMRRQLHVVKTLNALLISFISFDVRIIRGKMHYRGMKLARVGNVKTNECQSANEFLIKLHLVELPATTNNHHGLGAFLLRRSASFSHRQKRGTWFLSFALPLMPLPASVRPYKGWCRRLVLRHSPSWGGTRDGWMCTWRAGWRLS